MVVKLLPENAENVINYEVMKNNLSLNDGDTIINLAKREQDFPVHIDFCFDDYGMLMNGTGEGAQRYVAQIDIPAREYTETEEDNPDYDPDSEDPEKKREKITKRTPVKFSMDKVTLTLWELEV